MPQKFTLPCSIIVVLLCYESQIGKILGIKEQFINLTGK